MASANDIITRAGRRAQTLAGEEAFTAAEGVDALQLLNDMMHGFGPRGIAYAHTTLLLTDTVNMPDEQIRNLILMMAAELLIDFGLAVTPALDSQITNAKNELQAAYYVSAQAQSDPMLRPRWPGRFDVTRPQ